MSTTIEKAPVDRRARPRRLELCLVFSGEAIALPPSVFVPGRGATPIGREVSSGVALPGDPRASRHHATVHRSPLGELRLVDEKSRNGTFVNGVRVTDTKVDDGDVIAVGDSLLVVREAAERDEDASVPSLLGTAPSIRALRAAIHKLGPTMATVLLRAESGSGKEVVAQALHAAGRPGKPFVAVNCSAIPESVAESQLFGHLAGAFTGAVARPGLFRAADGGTIFLDEVGDLPEAIQPKLLRVLQDRQVLPVGATAPIACDVRILAATNRDLEADIAARRFRGDLFARLAEIPLTIPPIRARREDILLLFAHALGPGAKPLSPALAEALLLYDYPFNVRQILAFASQLRLRGEGAEVYDLPLLEGRLTAPTPAEIEPTDRVERDDSIDETSQADREAPPDRDKLEALLATHRGVVADVARAMKRSRKQVYRWITQHDIDVERFRG
ncbi:MAG: sigma 54-interacting transcriptional regulator [Byssovorax sp.]